MCENIRARMYVCVCVSVSEYLVLPCFICTFVRIFVINTYPDSVVALFSSISYRFVNFSTTLDDITLEKHNKCLFIIHAHSNHFTLFTLLYPLRTEQSPCRSSPNAVKVPDLVGLRVTLSNLLSGKYRRSLCWNPPITQSVTLLQGVCC